MFLKININEDVEFVLRKMSKKKNRDMAVIASELLNSYVADMDIKDFENSNSEKIKNEDNKKVI
jgi:hypothetical protein